MIAYSKPGFKSNDSIEPSSFCISVLLLISPAS